MKFRVDELTKDVRVALDQNMTSDALMALEDIDTLSLEEIIKSKLEDAARFIEGESPVYLLDGIGEPFAGSIGWEAQTGIGPGYILLPEDFLRLISFQMSDWSVQVTQAIPEDSPLYMMQRSRFPGIRGCPQKPVVAITNRAGGLVLEFYSCSAGPDVHVKRARYLPIPKIEDGMIDLCPRLRSSIVYYTAYMTSLSLQAADMAAALLSISKDLMR